MVKIRRQQSEKTGTQKSKKFRRQGQIKSYLGVAKSKSCRLVVAKGIKRVKEISEGCGTLKKRGRRDWGGILGSKVLAGKIVFDSPEEGKGTKKSLF